MRDMNDLFLLEPEYRYHAERTRRQLKPVRNRRWLRRLHDAEPGGGHRREELDQLR